jgi:very-short-patch-repair endonuclease
MTLPEVYLWNRLRVLSEGAPRWRRQAPFGPYVLDFYCARARLVAEVDGWGHNMGDQPERDIRRDAWLAAHRLEIIRLPASGVLADPDEAADGLIRLAFERAAPPPSRR